MAKKDPIETQNEKFDKLTKLLEETNRRDKIEDSRDARIALIQDKRNAMMAEAADVSYEEAERRNAHNDEILKLEKERKEKAEIAGDKSVAVRKMDRVIARKKYIEDKRIQLQNAFTLEGIQDGIKNVAESVGGKIAATGSVLMKGIGVLALFAFIQSDMFKAGVKFLVEFLTEFADLLDPNGKTSLGLNKATAGLLLALGLVALKITSLITGVGMVKLAITGIQVAVGFLATGFGGLLSGLGAVLIPLLPVIAVVAAIAAVAYGVVRIFQGFQEYFSEANEQFGFFGGILAGFTGGIKTILGDVAGVLDAIFGFFGFPDLMDPIIKAIEDFDVMDFVGGIMNFFSNLGNIIMESLTSFGLLFKAIGAGALAALTSPFSPIESFNKAFDEVMAGGKEDSKPNLENIAAAGAAMSGGEEDPARFIARKENEDMMMRRKEEMMGDKRAVNIVNNNSVVKGGDSYSEVRGGDIRIHDSANDPYTNMT